MPGHVNRPCKRVVDYDVDTAYVADQFEITRRRIQRLAKAYQDTDQIPKPNTPDRKPYAEYPIDLDARVLDLRDELGLGAVAIAHVLRQRDGPQVDNNKIHEILQIPWRRRREREQTEPTQTMGSLRTALALDPGARTLKARDWVIAVTDDASHRIHSDRRQSTREEATDRHTSHYAGPTSI